MTKLAAHHWRLPNEVIVQELKSLLAADFKLREHLYENNKYQLFDTFENHLWHSNILLFVKDKSPFIFRSSKQELTEVPLLRSPRFWWNFPQGVFQTKLKEALGFWSVNPICALELTSKRIELLDSEDKIVCRIKLTHHTRTAAETQSYLSVLPLRGYRKYATLAVNRCQPLLTEPCKPPDLRALALIQNIQIKPQSKKIFSIEPSEPAKVAIKKMAHSLLAKAREYEQGIKSDIDTEFLHQYRVTIRKLRSLIKLTKQAFTPEFHCPLKAKLAQLMTPTNLQRDLDVFLLNRIKYENLLPLIYQEGINTLFDQFQIERNSAFKKTKAFFNSKRYQSLITQVEQLLASPGSDEEDKTQIPIAYLAKKRILKRYQKICLLGQRIDDQTPDAEVHDLRIECKNLRYLMDFFKELFPENQILALTKPLKELQSILGDFNDYSVQMSFLTAHLETCNSPDMFAAINGLVAILYQRQREERSRVQAAFSSFSDDAIAADFKLLFS